MTQCTFKDIDLQAGDDFSAFAGQVCRSTYDCCPYATVVDMSLGNFRGPRGIRLNIERFPQLKDAIITAAPDGVGTATAVHVVAGNQSSSAYNLFAMGGGDVTRYGGARLFCANVLDVEAVGKPGSPVRLWFEGMMLALGKIAHQEGVILLSGETAELGQFVGSVDPSIPVKYNWSGFMVGLYHKDFMIIGDRMRPGQILVAFYQPAYRSNGFTTVRNGSLTNRFGEKWWASKDPAFLSVISDCAAPAVLYDRLLEVANGWGGGQRIPITGIAHISGGGIPGKLGGLLKPHSLSAVLDDLFPPSPVVQLCHEWAGKDLYYTYGHWNSGQGVIAAMEESDLDRFTALARNFGVEIKPCGKIVEKIEGASKPAIQIISKYDKPIPLMFDLDGDPMKDAA